MIIYIYLVTYVLEFFLILKVLNLILNKRKNRLHKLAFNILILNLLVSICLSIIFYFYLSSNIFLIQLVILSNFFTFLIIQLKYFLTTSIRVKFLQSIKNKDVDLSLISPSYFEPETLDRINRLIDSGELSLNKGLLVLNKPKLLNYVRFYKLLKNVWGVRDNFNK